MVYKTIILKKHTAKRPSHCLIPSNDTSCLVATGCLFLTVWHPAHTCMCIKPHTRVPVSSDDDRYFVFSYSNLNHTNMPNSTFILTTKKCNLSQIKWFMSRGRSFLSQRKVHRISTMWVMPTHEQTQNCIWHLSGNITMTSIISGRLTLTIITACLLLYKAPGFSWVSAGS